MPSLAMSGYAMLALEPETQSIFFSSSSTVGHVVIAFRS